jgi:hypothetical protein
MGTGIRASSATRRTSMVGFISEENLGKHYLDSLQYSKTIDGIYNDVRE